MFFGFDQKNSLFYYYFLVTYKWTFFASCKLDNDIHFQCPEIVLTIIKCFNHRYNFINYVL